MNLFHKKLFYLTTLFASGMFGISSCDAQSIVGKWQRDFTKIYTIDKSNGQQVPVTAEQQKLYDEEIAKRDYVEILEFKTDNTYTSTVTSGGEQSIHSEHYSISGNKLDLNIPLVKGEKTTITIASLTRTQMTWNLLFMNKLTGVGYKRVGG